MRLKTYRPQGFTLVELQVAIVVLLFGLLGLTRLAMNELAQVQWLERQKQIYAYIPTDMSQSIFTEITSGSSPSGLSYVIGPNPTFTVTGSSVVAAVTLEAVGP